MKRALVCLTAFALFALAPITAPALAYDQPAVNLGFTSFLDGGPPAGPGIYFQEYLQFYSSDKLVDFPAGNLDTTSDTDVFVSLSQLIYQSDQQLLLGGKWGLNVMLPYVDIDNNLLPHQSGFGDVLVGPFLQWDPIMGQNGPVFMQRVELQMIFPTGTYSSSKALNPGSNFFSFNPYWSGTLFLSPKMTVSTRLHYLWNAKNDDPFVGTPGAPSETQAGQAFHGNFAAEYEVIPKMLRLGVNGYYFKQISSSEADGVKVPGKEKVLGIGPGAMFSFSQDTHLFFNAFFESNVERRPEGERYTLRLVHHF